MEKPNTEFIERVRELRKEEYTEAEIAKMYGLTTIELRKKISKIHKQNREILKKEALRLREEGKPINQIALELGKQESTVRLLLGDLLFNTDHSPVTPEQLNNELEELEPTISVKIPIRKVNDAEGA